MRVGIDASRAFVDQPTGTERYCLEMLRSLFDLSEAGDHEWVLFVKRGQVAAAYAFLSGKTNVRVIEIPLAKLWTQVGLALKTWTSAIDLLWVPAHTLPVFRKPGLKTVVTIHGIEYEWLPAYENRLQRWYLPLSTQYAVATASKIVAVSEFTKQQLVERLGADEKNITTIYEGYTSPKVPRLSKEREVKGEVLKKFALTSKKYVLFVGTVQPRKNLVRLIEAFAKLDKPALKLVIAGKLGWMFQEVVDAPVAYGVSDRVVITGYVSDAERSILLQNALFYAQSSITEGFGLPILEAWAEGLAVASSRGGALKEIVGGAGVLFDPVKISEISLGMEKLLDSKTRTRYEQQGKERLTDFSWDNAAKYILELFVTTVH